MLKIEEVYLKTVKEYEENPDGSHRVIPRKEYWTRDCLINPDYIVAVYDHEFRSSSDLTMVGSLPIVLDPQRLLLPVRSLNLWMN